MGIAPIGPIAMLPLFRSSGGELEPAPMERLERSARTEDETYSSSNEDGRSEPGGHESGNEAQDYELDGASFSPDAETGEGQSRPAESLADTAPVLEQLPHSSVQISLFA